MNMRRRKLDNTAKVFSLDEKGNSNTFRLSIILKQKIDPIILKLAVTKTLDIYPSYKVKIKSGFFWNYLENNEKELIIEEKKEMSCKSIDLTKNNEYLFKVTYYNNKINLDVFHVLTDGLGGINFLKEILYNYLNLKYNIKINNQNLDKNKLIQDENLINVDKKLKYKEKNKKVFLISEKSDLLKNKTYHYILDVKEFKNICKKHKVSMTEYLTAILIYSIYETVYDKSSSRDIVVSIPIDLRKHYNVECFSNFFTFMCINGNVSDNKDVKFITLLDDIHKQFQKKLTLDNIKIYLARDVKLGTNIGIKLIPLFMKRLFMKYFSKIVHGKATTTLSNVGSIDIEERYKKYVDNIIALVSTSESQKVKCTICSYQNNLTVSINSNLINNNLEDKFYKLLVDHIGKVSIISNNN